MKLNGIFGKGSGKVGESVWAVSGGVQIVRPYNPNVTNPSTDAQVEQRAKFKLMSQIAAALAPAIAFKKKGLVSARNQFVSANIGKTTYAAEKASVVMTELDLTGASSLFPNVRAIQGIGDAIQTDLMAAADERISAVLYCLVGYNSMEPASILDVKLVREAGEGRTFPATMVAIQESAVVYAYGLIAGNSYGGEKFGNYYLTTTGVKGELSSIAKAIKSATAFTETKATSISVQ